MPLLDRGELTEDGESCATDVLGALNHKATVTPQFFTFFNISLE